MVRKTPDQFVMENELLRVEIDRNGDMSALYDKAYQRVVLAPGQTGNCLQAFEDRSLDWDAWDIDTCFENKVWEAAPGNGQVEHGF